MLLRYKKIEKPYYRVGGGIVFTEVSPRMKGKTAIVRQVFNEERQGSPPKEKRKFM